MSRDFGRRPDVPKQSMMPSRTEELTSVTERLARVVVAQRDLAMATGSVEEMMQRVCLLAGELAHAQGAAVEVVEGDWLVFRAATGAISAALGLQVPLTGSLSGQAVTRRETLECHDAETDPRVDRAMCRRLGVRSLAVVPLIYEDAAFAALEVVSDEPDAFGDGEIAVLELLGAALGSAVGRVLAKRAAQALEAVTRALGTAADGEAGLTAALQALGESLVWDHVGLWLRRPDGGHVLEREWARPWAGYDVVEPRVVGPGEGLPAAVGAAGDPVWRQADADVRPAQDAALALGTSVALVVPAGSVGVLTCMTSQPRAADGPTTATVMHVGSLLGQFVRRVVAEKKLAEEAAGLTFVLQCADRMAALTTMPEVRTALCVAAAQLTRAAVVLLFERREDRLVCVEAAGRPAPAIELWLDERSGAATAVQTSERLFVADVHGSSAIGQRLADEDGIVSLAFQPVLRDGATVAVLALGWDEPTVEADARLDAVTLLAVEAVIAQDRLDLLQRLDRAARTDPLTGLYNRRVWDEALADELRRAARTGRPLSLAVLDLDRFKDYNDTHGHQAGDALLREAAAAWRAEVRATDTIVRYGGEEFAVLLPDTGALAAAALAERLRAVVPGGETCSIGVAEWEAGQDGAALVARADAALYAAKATGRNRVVTAAASA